MMQSSLLRQITINIAVVGDSKVGKSTIIYNYNNDSVGNNNIPQKLENTKKLEHFDSQNVELNILDTIIEEDQPDLSQIKPDIFLLVFSVVDNYTFNNIISKWIPLLNIQDENKNNSTLILVGNKIDLRQEKNSNHLTYEQVEETLKKNKLNLKYIECSAVTQEGLQQIFQSAMWFGLFCKGYIIEKEPPFLCFCQII